MAKNFASAWGEEFFGSIPWALLQLAVTIALGLQAWLVWASEKASPTQVFAWMLALLVYVVAVVIYHSWRTWQKERARVLELEQQLNQTMPFFTQLESAIKQLREAPAVASKGLPPRFELMFAYHIRDGRRPAQNTRSHFMVAKESMLEPPMFNLKSDAGYTEAMTHRKTHEIGIGTDVPPLVFAVRLDYRDKATGHEMSQRFYYRWPGSAGGLFTTAISGLPQADTDRFVSYLRKHLGDWEL